MRPLAVLSEKRERAYPQTATAVEQGFGELVATVWFGVAAPKDTPPAIVNRMNMEVNAALHRPDAQQRLQALSMRPLGGKPDDMRYRMSDQANVRWLEVIKRAGIKID